MTATLYDVNEEVLGLIRWFAERRVLSWSFFGEARSTGWLDDERSPGGLPIDPDLHWIAVQAYAFLHNRETRSLASATNALDITGQTSPFNPSRALCFAQTEGSGLVAVTAGASVCDGEPDGCTLPGRSWWDGPVLSECCNTHDICYEMDWLNDNCCTAKSWLFLGQRSCFRCNAAVVKCFLTAFLNSGYDCAGDPQCLENLAIHQDNSCERDPGGWCPAYCETCTGSTF